MALKLIRDPVHDVIALQTKHPVDGLIFALLNTAELQRLRRVRQLGMASLAYPGADHSRYSHSLGVMETCRKALDHLAREQPIDEADRLACVAAALLHDLGHGPFSHVFERVSGVKHERLTYRVILDGTSEVHRVLIRHDATLPERVVSLLVGHPARGYQSDLLSSQLDVDRLDYLLRDNLTTGSQYGDYDLRWLLEAMTIDPATGRLAIGWKGISAVEAYLQARYHMYRNVYFHKVVRAGEGMVKLVLQRAKRLAVQDRLSWPKRDDAVYKTLLGQRLSMPEFTELDDVSVLQCFKIWAKSDDAMLASLCNGLLYRRLFKTIDLSHVTDAIAIARAVAKAGAMILDAGGEPTYEMFYDAPANTPYQTTAGGYNAADEILVREPNGRSRTLADVSPFAAGLSKQLMFRRLHVSAAWRDRVEAAVAQELA